MTVGRDYMLKKPAGPSVPKLFLDTQIVPLAVNTAGRIEVALDRAARRAGVRPAVIVSAAAALAGALLLGLARTRRPETSPGPTWAGRR